MTDKKVLNEEELEKVNGGSVTMEPESLTWRHYKGKPLKIKLSHCDVVTDGIVEKLGYTFDGLFYYAVVYVKCLVNPNISGWYLDTAEDFVRQSNHYEEEKVTEKTW